MLKKHILKWVSLSENAFEGIGENVAKILKKPYENRSQKAKGLLYLWKMLDLMSLLVSVSLIKYTESCFLMNHH